VTWWTASASDSGASCGFSCDAGLAALWRVSLCDSALLDSSIQQHRRLWEGGGKETPPQKTPKSQKNKVKTIYYRYYLFLTALAFIFNFGSSLFSVPAGITLHRLEEARFPFLTAPTLHRSRHSLLFPPIYLGSCCCFCCCWGCCSLAACASPRLG